MRWLCVQDFGFTKRGDFIVLPDDAEASPQYFVRAPEDEEAPSGEELAEETQPDATDEARGISEPAPENSTKKGKG